MYVPFTRDIEFQLYKCMIQIINSKICIINIQYR